MIFRLIIIFIIATCLTAALVPVVRKIAQRFKIEDLPNEPRKIHSQPIPLLGGLAPFFVFAVGVFILFMSGFLSQVRAKNLIGLLIGGAFLMIGGALDDKYRLKPHQQIIWPILAVLAVIISGIGIRALNNPFGGFIALDQWEWTVFWAGGWPYRVTLLADLFTLIWLLGIQYTTKFLDGLDGLTSGVTIIGALIIAAVSLRPPLHQTGLALLAALSAGAFLGFLFWNWHPAKIFLGEGGSLFAGFLLGALAILSVSKVAVTLLVVGIPALDVAWVILRRIFWGKRAPFQGDDKHLHFRLLRAGFSHQQAVIFLLAVSAAFGSIGLLASAQGKLFGLVLLFAFLIICGIIVVRLQKTYH